MRILLIQNGAPPYVQARLKAIAALGEAELVLATASDSEHFREDRVPVIAGVRHVRLGTGDLWQGKLWRLIPATIAVIRREQPDVCFIGGWAPSYLSAALVWCWVHGIPTFSYSVSGHADERYAHPLIRALRDPLRNQLAARFDRVMVSGVRAAAFARDIGIPPQRLRMAGYACGSETYREASLAATPADLQAFAARRSLPEGGYLLHVGRHAPEKNLSLLLRAYAMVVGCRSNVPALVQVGSGPLTGQLEREAEALGLGGKVIFASTMTSAELALAYSSAKAVLLPSLSEPWGAVVNEAMSCGTPCVVSRRAGCFEDLVVEGETGWGCDPEDPASVAEAIGFALDEGRPREVLRQRLWQQLQPHLTPHFARTFLQTAKEAYAKHHRHATS